MEGIVMKYSVCARRGLAVCVVGLLSTQVLGQAVTEAQELACRQTVGKFEESMAFVRKSVGYEKATEMKEALLPNKLESELFAKEGYCGVARYLREKKLVDKK
jgi:hypothetical protein